VLNSLMLCIHQESDKLINVIYKCEFHVRTYRFNDLWLRAIYCLSFTGVHLIVLHFRLNLLT
jgi:hypothetical protein